MPSRREAWRSHAGQDGMSAPVKAHRPAWRPRPGAWRPAAPLWSTGVCSWGPHSGCVGSGGGCSRNVALCGRARGAVGSALCLPWASSRSKPGKASESQRQGLRGTGLSHREGTRQPGEAQRLDQGRGPCGAWWTVSTHPSRVFRLLPLLWAVPPPALQTCLPWSPCASGT